MIILENVSKRYIVDHAPGKWVLQGVSLVIPPKACVGIIGSKGSGKSTLLRLLADTEPPTSGRVERSGRVATPMKYVLSLQPLLSGRQNAKFICRINGYAVDMIDRLSRIEKLAGLGAKFDKPVRTYTALMKSSLSFALSMAFDFDMYISDGFDFTGETAFKDKNAADVALKSLTEHAGIIMTAKGALGENVLRRYCKAGIWLREGGAKWFDDINDAIEAHRSSLQPGKSSDGVKQQALTDSEHVQPIMAKIKHMQNSLAILSKGLCGLPVIDIEKKIPGLMLVAKNIGMELATRKQISERGYQIREGMMPILHENSTGGEQIEYFDLKTQCEIIEHPQVQK